MPRRREGGGFGRYEGVDWTQGAAAAGNVPWEGVRDRGGIRCGCRRNFLGEVATSSATPTGSVVGIYENVARARAPRPQATVAAQERACVQPGDTFRGERGCSVARVEFMRRGVAARRPDLARRGRAGRSLLLDEFAGEWMC